MPNAIDSLIDSDEIYAYAYMQQEHGYGHMHVKIHLSKPEWSRRHGVIAISCQIGGDGNQCEHPYAQRYGFESDGNEGTLENLKTGVKVLTKIEKYLTKIGNEFGYAKTYAEYCQRILIGAGVKTLIAEPGAGWATGGRMANKELVRVGPQSIRKLDLMEESLIARFSRKAA